MRIAVTGASGRLGGQVVRLLAARHEHRVVALSRQAIAFEPALAPVEQVRADYGDRHSLDVALRGIDTLVFISSDGPATTVLPHHANVIRAAKTNDVAHVVALSGVDAAIESPFCYAATNGLTEQALAESGCPTSIARASLFTEFFVQRFVDPARTTGQIRLPAADGRISLVSRSDVGRCLAALAASEPSGRHHDLTGSESLDLHAIAAMAASVWKTPLTYVPVSPLQHRVEMARADEDAWWLYAFSSMFDSIREHRWTSTTEEVARLTGHRPRSVRDVLTSHEPTSHEPTSHEPE